MLGIEASLIRPPSPQPPPPVVESVGAGVAEDSADEVSVTASLVVPSYPPGGVVPDGQARDSEFSARA